MAIIRNINMHYFFNYVLIIRYNNFWLILVNAIVAFGAGSYLGYQGKKIREKRYGTGLEYYHVKINILAKILEEKNLYNPLKLERLTQQIKEELPTLKNSDNMFKPLYTIASLILIPIFMLFVNWILNATSKITESLFIIGSILSLIVALMGLFYMTKPLIQDFLDSDYKKMKKLCDIMTDIVTKDFI